MAPVIKTCLRLGLCMLALASANPLQAAEEPVLSVFNWADYIAPDTIARFEAETGIRVNYDVYDSTEVVEARLLAGATGYDVVFHGFRYAQRLIPVGVYQPLDRARLPGWERLDPRLLEAMQAFDPGNRYGLPYMWGSTGIAFNRKLVAERLPNAPLDSAALIFDPAVVAQLADCGVTLLDEPTDVLPMALLYLGFDANSTDPREAAAAEELLKAVRPHIRYYSTSRMISDLPNEEVCVAMSYAGDYATAQARAREVGADVDLGYSVPREGAMLWSDGIFIPADAPHPENAHRFLDYLLRPEVIAEISNFVHYANANRAALPLVDASVRDNPAIYPTDVELSRLHYGKIFGPKEERSRTRSWSRVKTGL